MRYQQRMSHVTRGGSDEVENYATSGYSHIGGLLREDCERVRVGISLGFFFYSHLLRSCEGPNKNESDILGLRILQ